MDTNFTQVKFCIHFFYTFKKKNKETICVLKVSVLSLHQYFKCAKQNNT